VGESFYLINEEIDPALLRRVFDVFCHLQEEEGNKKPKLWLIVKFDSRRAKELLERINALQKLREAFEEVYNTVMRKREFSEPPGCDAVAFLQCGSVDLAVLFEGKGNQPEAELADQLFSCFLFSLLMFSLMGKENCKVIMTFKRAKGVGELYEAYFRSPTPSFAGEKRIERFFKSLVRMRRKYKSELLREVLRKASAYSPSSIIPSREEALDLLRRCSPQC